ncbi:hypothetical protein BDZ91DRAFT_713150 [Kalaharituber pfeilii]|nr:hypothetical protein BDZ91DRAFT_713150 [Kalaharituber pfeilii]
MSNTTLPDWHGGEPDSAGIYPSQYLLGQRFLMPFPGGSKNALAVAKSQEFYITSLYTVLVTSIFAAWWILIATALPYVIPKFLSRQRSVHMVRTWAINEPLQASVLLLQYCWRLVSCHLRTQSANKAAQDSDKHPMLISNNSSGIPANLTFNWAEFTITLIIILLAAGTFVGGIIAGIFLPTGNIFILGNAAPANPYRVYYGKGPSYVFKNEHPDWAGAMAHAHYVHANSAAFRAIATVDSGSFRNSLNTAVTFQKVPTPSQSAMASEDNYEMKYVFSVTGFDMGLQHAPDLAVELQGHCRFMYEWIVEGIPSYNPCNSDIDLVEFNLWPNDTIYQSRTVNRCRSDLPTVKFEYPRFHEYAEHKLYSAYEFAILPLLPEISSWRRNKDPWYLNDKKEGSSKHVRRPALRCRETLTWSYQGWTGTLVDIHNNTVPNLYLSNATIELLEAHFKWKWSHIVRARISPLAEFGEAIAPMTLDSLHATIGPVLLRYGKLPSAAADLQRLVHGTYIMTRDLFRSTAIDYSSWMDSPAFPVKNDTLHNRLRMDDGEPLPGAGDFVIYSDRVTAFRLETLVAIPTVLVFSWLLVLVCRWLAPYKDLENMIVSGGDTCKSRVSEEPMVLVSDNFKDGKEGAVRRRVATVRA